MDLLTALLCLAIGGALPILAVALVFRRASRQLSTASAYREIARTLELDVDTRGLSLHGVRDDRILWVGEVLVGEGAERRREVHVMVAFRTPLGLGTEVRDRTTRRQESEGLNQADLDKRLVVRSHHPPGVEALRREDVQRVLLAFAERARELHLTDERLRLRLRRPPSTAQALGALVQQLEDAASVIEDAAVTVPRPQTVQDWVPLLVDVAEPRGLQVDLARVSLRGALAGWPLVVVPNHRGGTWCVWLTLRFAPDVDTGLRVHPQRDPEGDGDGQDIVVGDRAFDDAFVVKGYDPEAVRSRLDHETRKALLQLLRLGPVYLDDHGLTVRAMTVSALDAALEQVAIVADRFGMETQEVRIIDVG